MNRLTAAIDLASTTAPGIDVHDRGAGTLATDRAVVAEFYRTVAAYISSS